MQTYHAIIPAGGKLPDEFVGSVSTDRKALLEIGGSTLLSRTVTALRESGVVGKIAVVGSEEVREHALSLGVELVVPEGSSSPDNILRAIKEFSKTDAMERLLIVTCDLPFLTPELIRGFVAKCPEKDFCVALIQEQAFNERFPGTPATFASLKDGVWTTGCIYLANVPALIEAEPYLEKVFQQRKSKLGMAKLLGFGFVVKFLTKQMTLLDIEKKITDLLRCSGAAVTGCAPEFAFDIDYLEDYRYAEKYARERVHVQS